MVLIDAKTQTEVELAQPVPHSGRDAQLVVDWGMQFQRPPESIKVKFRSLLNSYLDKQSSHVLGLWAAERMRMDSRRGPGVL